MSKLEAKAKRSLASLLNDLALPLNSNEQLCLSLWSTKTAMVFEQTSRAQAPFYSKADRNRLRSGELPPLTTIWIGRYGQSNMLYGEARKLYERTSRNDNPFCDGHATTFVIRRLVIQALTLRVKPAFENRDVTLHIKPGPWDYSLIQLWPIANQVVKWPPELSFDNSTISCEDLSRRFVADR
jgi:hypothetical protein